MQEFNNNEDEEDGEVDLAKTLDRSLTFQEQMLAEISKQNEVGIENSKEFYSKFAISQSAVYIHKFFRLEMHI